MQLDLLLLICVLLPFAGMAAPLLIGRSHPDRAGWAALPIALFSFFGFLWIASSSGNESFYGRAEFHLSWIPSLGLDFLLFAPGYSLFFALLISGIGTLVVVYGVGYMHGDPDQPKFFCYLLFFMGSMLGMACAGDLMLLFVFWELTSISSFLLIGYFHQDEPARYGAQAAFLITGVGALAMLAGIVLLALDMQGLNDALGLGLARTEVLRFDVLYEHSGALLQHSNRLWIILTLTALGIFTKSAQAPFHVWLPGAMEAPTPVSAYLHSATMVKAGLFLAARLAPIFAPLGVWFLLMGYAGLLTFVVGAVLAFFARDIKALLAYTTISQLGLILSVYGHATYLENNADIYHILNHAAYKASLFMVAGILAHALHTRRLDEMRGLARSMPITCGITILASVALAGLPPTTGFVSKELFIKSVLKLEEKGIYGAGFPAELLLVLIGASFVVAVAMRLVFDVFFGKPLHDESLPKTCDPGAAKHEHEHGAVPHGPPCDPPLTMWLPAGLLAGFTLVGAFFPDRVEQALLRFFEAGTLHDPIPSDAHLYALWHGFNMPLAVTGLALVGGFFIYAARHKFVAMRMDAGDRSGGLFELVSPSKIYHVLFTNMSEAAANITRTYLRGDLTVYLMFSFAFFAIFTLAATVLGMEAGSLLPASFSIDALGIAAMALFLGMMVCVLGLIRVRQRLAMIIITSITGYLSCLFYVMYRAPDLALTQLLVETVSITLFLITFRLLPTFQEQDSQHPRRVRLMQKTMAVAVGLTAFVVTWSVVQNPLLPSISPFFLMNTSEGAGGANTVNTILVDFRAYDTLGEIAVLALALLGTAVLLSRKTPKPAPTLPSRGESRREAVS